MPPANINLGNEIKTHSVVEDEDEDELEPWRIDISRITASLKRAEGIYLSSESESAATSDSVRSLNGAL
jgi:hypothetical protein